MILPTLSVQASDGRSFLDGSNLGRSGLSTISPSSALASGAGLIATYYFGKYYIFTYLPIRWKIDEILKKFNKAAINDKNAIDTVNKAIKDMSTIHREHSMIDQHMRDWLRELQQAVRKKKGISDSTKNRMVSIIDTAKYWYLPIYAVPLGIVIGLMLMKQGLERMF